MCAIYLTDALLSDTCRKRMFRSGECDAGGSYEVESPAESDPAFDSYRPDINQTDDSGVQDGVPGDSSDSSSDDLIDTLFECCEHIGLFTTLNEVSFGG